MYDFNLVLLLLQQMCVFLVIAWLMSKTPLFIPLMQVTVRLPHKFLCYIVFSIFCIMGTWFGLHIDDSIANTRAIGAVMGGLLGGPVVGGLVGLTGGLHRYSMGGMTALSCMISTIVEGLLGGLVHSILIRRGRTDKVFNPITAGAVTFVAEMVQMLIILAIARPYEDAVRLVSNIAAPMMVTNTVGAVHKLRPDVLFLDIQMPRISGLEMVGMLDPEHRPYIVFLTAFDEYAIKAFEEHAFDYLLKPIDEARLEKTLARLRQERSKQDVSLLPENQQALKFIPCTGHSRIYLLQMKDVAFVSSRMSGVYVTSHEGKEGFTELTLRTLESRTPLLRCHRQYLVNLAHLQEIRLEDNGQAELILRNGLTVPVSRRYLKSLKEAIGL